MNDILMFMFSMSLLLMRANIVCVWYMQCWVRVAVLRRYLVLCWWRVVHLTFMCWSFFIASSSRTIGTCLDVSISWSVYASSLSCFYLLSVVLVPNGSVSKLAWHVLLGCSDRTFVVSSTGSSFATGIMLLSLTAACTIPLVIYPWHLRRTPPIGPRVGFNCGYHRYFD